MSRRLPGPVKASHAIGIDGCAAGWVACIVPVQKGNPDPAQARCTLVAQLAPLLAEFKHAVIAIDMPIGLPDVPERGGRACDRLARALLPAGRKSSVFSPPTGPALAAAMAELARSGSRSRARLEASRINQSLAGAGVQARIGAQCFGIFPKIAELDAIMTPRLQRRVVEAHPEVIFELLAGGEPLARKKDTEGLDQRTRLLKAAGFTTIERLIHVTTGARVAADDVLDSAACAWTACRRVLGRAERIGERQANVRNLVPAIWR